MQLLRQGQILEPSGLPQGVRGGGGGSAGDVHWSLKVCIQSVVPGSQLQRDDPKVCGREMDVSML